MKVNKPIRLFVPAAIMNVINEKVKTKKENYVYIVHYLLLQPCKDKRLADFVPINRQKIEKLINCKVTPYIKFLEKCELLESDNKFIPGEKSLHYRINPSIKFDCNTFELQPGTQLFRNILQDIRNEKSHFNQLEPHLNEMRRQFFAMQYDYKEALEWILNHAESEKRISYMIAINQLQDSRFRYFKRNKTNNRLDTNLTNLKKELRQYIVGNYTSIDLKNSQPFFLSILLEKFAKILNHFSLKKLDFNLQNIQEFKDNKHLPYCYRIEFENLVQYFGLQTVKELSKIRKKHDFAFSANLWKLKNWTSQGIFYDEMQQQFSNLTREDLKEIMFEVLFSQNFIFYGAKRFVPYQKEKEVFFSVFPAIYETIEALKGKDHARLAIYLQRFESKLFIDTIAMELVQNGIIPFTIHDSVIVPTDKLETALNIIRTVFKNEVGHIPTFHVEPLKEQKNERGNEENFRANCSHTIRLSNRIHHFTTNSISN